MQLAEISGPSVPDRVIVHAVQQVFRQGRHFFRLCRQHLVVSGRFFKKLAGRALEAAEHKAHAPVRFIPLQRSPRCVRIKKAAVCNAQEFPACIQGVGAFHRGAEIGLRIVNDQAGDPICPLLKLLSCHLAVVVDQIQPLVSFRLHSDRSQIRADRITPYRNAVFPADLRYGVAEKIRQQYSADAPLFDQVGKTSPSAGKCQCVFMHHRAG